MSIVNSKKILSAHGVPFYESNGRLYVDSMINGAELFEVTEDVTDWSYTHLYSWLGY